MKQIMTLTLGWDANTRLQGKGDNPISDEDYIGLRDALELPELPPLDKRAESYFHSDMIGTINDVAALTKLGLAPSVTRVRGIFQESLAKIGVPDPELNQQQIVNITIPNAALFAVRTLQVIENECTEFVQSWLSMGWRIVAVCPPNDCRRPTFILGHADTNPERP